MPIRHNLPGMDLRQLRTFVTVAEQGSVSKASTRLRIAQPALSRQIKDLEQDLGIRLFDRIRRRLVLTVEGEQLLGDCRGILGGVGSLTERAQLLRRPDAGTLKVAATPQTIDGVLSGLSVPFRKTPPGRSDQAERGVWRAPDGNARTRRDSCRDRHGGGHSSRQQ
jgi:LysR family transcriptional regulator, nitrogen assimilation regulatory protein